MILGNFVNIWDCRPRKGGYGECKTMHSQDARPDDLLETSIFSTSPWNCDPIFSTDLSPFPGLDLRNGFDLLGYPHGSDNMDDGLGPSSYSTSPTHSNGSEGDNLFSSTQLDQQSLVDYNGSMSTRFDQLFLSQFSDEESLIEHANDSTLNCTTEFIHPTSVDNGLSNDSSSDIFPSLPCSPLQQRKKRRAKDPLSNSISWSGMSSEEQLETVEAITRIISQQMGLREQLEVIKIIDPLAWVSPTDTEFVIDLACLNDEKLRRIRAYVKSHATDVSEQMPRTKQESSSSESSATLAPPNSGNNIPHTKGRTRRKMSETEKLELKAWRQRQRKKQRQQKKETQSGLFACEEVISVSLPTRYEEEEIDIDILD